MHEFALTESLRRIVLESAEAHRATRVREVRCRIGALRQVVPSIMRTAFEACCVDTMMQGAKLTIEVDPVKVRCSGCGAETESETLAELCPACGGCMIALEGGTEMMVTSIDIDREDEDGNLRPAERAGAQ